MRFNLRTFALAALVVLGFAAPAAADVCIKGPFVARQPATTFEPVYGPARVQVCESRVREAQAAGANPPTAVQYRQAIAAVQQWCGQNCQPSYAVWQWIRSTPTAAPARPARQAAQPPAHRPARQPVAHRPVAPVHAAPPPVRQHGGVTVICGSCYIR